MTVNAMQQIAQTVPPSIIYADVERSLFEDMLKRWSTTKTFETKPQTILPQFMTQKEVAKKYGLSQKTLEQLRKQRVGFVTQVIKGTVYYMRQQIEDHYALVKSLHPKTDYAPPCSLTAFVSFARFWKQWRTS